MRQQKAFTLIEILLVLVIISIAAAVSVPNLVMSARGNRLRAAARTVIMAGRYARSMAVLRQEEVVLTFDLNAGTVSTGPDLLRPLDQVSVREVAVEGYTDEVSTEGRCQVVYRSHGRCAPYRVQLVDEHGGSITVYVDALGSVRTERD